MSPSATAALKSGGQPKFRLIVHARTHWPLWAWAALLLAVNLPLGWGEVRHSMLFLPEAVGSGQWWRVLTYPLVHLSWYHLALDAGGFLLLYACLEEDRLPARFIYLLAASAGALLMTLAFDPAVSQQGLSGLSGVAHGLMAITALEMIRHPNQRTWGVVCLAVVVGKCAYELWAGHVLFEFMHMGMCGRPMASSHTGGVLGGCLAYFAVQAVLGQGPKTTAGPVDGKVKGGHQGSLWQKILMRLARAAAHTFYRVHHHGLENIPEKGPAVLVCNHVSYVDWLFIAGTCHRPVHFVMHADLYRKPLLHWVVRLACAIPIDSGRKNPALLHQGFRKIDHVLRSGGLVCIFPEGHLTRTGGLDRFRPGIERIIHHNPVPVIPLALRGLWGSFFSHKEGKPMRRLPRRYRARIDIAAGGRVAPFHVTAHHLKLSVQSLYGDLK